MKERAARVSMKTMTRNTATNLSAGRLGITRVVGLCDSMDVRTHGID